MAIKKYSQTDIHFTQRRRMERPMLLLVWLSGVIFCAIERNFFYFFLTTVGCGISYLASAKYLEISFRRLFINIAAAATIGWIAFEYKTRNLGMMISLGHFIMLMQLCKLFERKTSFDYVLTQLLALFLIIDGALFCMELWFAFAVLAFIFLSLYVAMIFTIKRDLDKAAAIILPGETGPLDPERLTWNAIRDWPGRPLRRVLIRLTTLSLIMGVITFFVAPRTAQSVLSASSISTSGQSAENSMHLGLQKQIYLSNKIVMYVKIQKYDRMVSAPNEESKYLRDNILTTYASSTWKAPQNQREFDPRYLPPVTGKLKKQLLDYNITMLSATAGLIPTPYPTVAIYGTAGNEFSCNSNLLFYNKTPEINLKYRASAFSSPFNEESLEYLSKIQKNNAVVPTPSKNVKFTARVHDRIYSLVEPWVHDLLEKRERLPEDKHGPINIQIAQRISDKLSMEYPYTLDLRDADPNRDGIEDFLFHMKKGHCEYFASALASMCCILEVPARIATGYHFDGFGAGSAGYTVRQKDAHAWVEVYSPETNWMIVDPSPISAIAAQKETSFWDYIKGKWQGLQVWWYSNVVDFDTEAQSQLKDELSDHTLSLSKEMGDFFKKLWESFKKLLMEGVVDRLLVKAFIWFLIGSLSLAALMILRSILFVIVARNTTMGKAILRKLKVVTKLVNLLEHNGHLYRPGNTLREWTQQAAKKFNLPADHLEYITYLQYRWRWGNQKPTEQEIKKANDYYENIVAIITAQKKDKKSA